MNTISKKEAKSLGSMVSDNLEILYVPVYKLNFMIFEPIRTCQSGILSGKGIQMIRDRLTRL